MNEDWIAANSKPKEELMEAKLAAKRDAAMTV